MTWLVLGAKGQLGQELINLLKIKNIEAIGKLISPNQMK